MYDRVKDVDNAAVAFTDYCLRMGEQPEKTHEEEVEFYNAFLYLANYHIKKGQYDDAYSYAFKTIEFDEVMLFYKFFYTSLLSIFVFSRQKNKVKLY